MTGSELPPSSSQALPEEDDEKVITKIMRFRLSRQGPWWERQFPALLGLAIVTIGVVVGVFLTLRKRQAQIEAAQPLFPQNIQTTNVFSSSFTVFWLTSQANIGFVSYGRTPDLGQTGFDDRDKESGESGTYLTHHVTVTDLSPETDYFFKIGSGGKLFDNNGAPFEIKTTPLISEASVFDPAYGQVFKADGSPAEGAVVFLTIPDCFPLSTLVKSSGGWLIAKNLSLERSRASFCRYPNQGGGYQLLVQGGLGEESQVSLLSGLDKPVPDITLGEDYSFKDLSALEPLGTPQPTPSFPPQTPSPLGTPSPFPSGDLNHDGVVNTWDLAILKSEFRKSPQSEEADLNRDGVVDQQDLDLLLEIFNQ